MVENRGHDPVVSSRVCPRADCGATLDDTDRIVCAADFRALASRCRGKKRLGEPEAAMIESRGGGVAYSCDLCRGWHNGRPTAGNRDLGIIARATVAALRADDRVGWRGILLLADAWAPAMSERERWRDNLDQRQAFA